MTIGIDTKFIQNIQIVGQNYAIEKIILFGSRARGDYKLTSDIDLAVFILPEFINRGGMISDISDIETLLKIDVVMINEQSNLELLENIKREGVVIYEQTNKKS